MSRSQRLYDLQTTDLEIDRLSEELADVESHFGETEELLAARERLESARVRKRTLEKQLHEIDVVCGDKREHIKPLETKLYSGRVGNPKELSDLHKQVQLLKDELRAVEDRELELMMASDEAAAELARTEASLSEVERAWRAEQQRLKDEQVRLNRELAALQARRSEQGGRVSAADLATYELLRNDPRRRAVSRVDRGTCQICRLALPAPDIRHARSTVELVRCSSCGRILYVP